MTCKEVRAHFNEDYFGVNRLDEFTALQEHIASCRECSSFAEDQKELARCLLLLRDSAPSMTRSVDSSVIAGYRACLAERERLGFVPAPAGTSPVGSLPWIAAIAFAVIVAGGVFLMISSKASHKDRVSSEGRSEMISHGSDIPKSQAVSLEPVRKQSNSIVTSAKHRSFAGPVPVPESWPSTDFQGLMYCDPLSCSEAMDIIRVQLPSATVALNPNSSATDYVYADVLVGADGIARGIRVVE